MSSIKVPPLGESIVEATISRWLKKEGDAVTSGDTLVELETDKITVEVPAPESGVLSARLKGEGEVVNVGDVLGEISATGAASGAQPDAPVLAAAPTPTPAATPAVTPTAVPAVPAVAPLAVPAAQVGDVAAKVSPAAARLATEQGVDTSAIAGTGRGGVVAKADVLDALRAATPLAAATPTATPTAASGPAPTATAAPTVTAAGTREVREKMTTRRRRIAENLLQSQQSTAHLTTFNEIDMSAISAFRARMKERVEKEQGVKLSFMPFFAKAACLALKAYPIVNAQIDGDSIIYKNYVNLGIAVASNAGLVVPNVKDADSKSVVEIGQDIGEIAKRARDGKLTMDDLTGGTFTITNGGVFGSLISTPIINYPQSAILGLHKIQDRPVAVDGAVEIRPMMYTALSYDHRIIDGQQAVLFLVRVKELMEDPAAMLVL